MDPTGALVIGSTDRGSRGGTDKRADPFWSKGLRAWGREVARPVEVKSRVLLCDQEPVCKNALLPDGPVPGHSGLHGHVLRYLALGGGLPGPRDGRYCEMDLPFYDPPEKSDLRLCADA